MPAFWEASGGAEPCSGAARRGSVEVAAAAAAAAVAAHGGGLALTAKGRSMRACIAEEMRGLETRCYFSSLEALPYVAREAQRARGGERWASPGAGA